MSENNNGGLQGHGEAKNKYLPDWDKAERHRFASQVGTYNDQDKDVCECCRQTIKKKEISLFQGTKTLEFLGFGFPLFYMFLRYCILLTFLLFLTQGLMSIYISVQEGAQYCSQNQQNEQTTVKHNSILHLNYFGQQNNAHFEAQAAKTQNLYLSKKCNNLLVMLARTQKKQVDYELIFRLSSFIIQITFLLYTKDMILKMLYYYDERESDLSDFTVMIKSIPQGKSGMKKRLDKFMNQYFYPENKIDTADNKYIHEIILISDVKAIEKAIQSFHAKLEQYLQHPTQENLQNLKEAQQIKKQIALQTIWKIQTDVLDSKEFIVIFETQKNKFDFLEYANLEDKNLILAGYYQSPDPIIVQEAPQPRQINYENLQYQKTRTSHILKGWGLSLLFLSVITVFFYFIQLVKSSKLDLAIQQLQENPNSSDAKTNKIIAGVIAWSCLIGILLFNKFVMGRVLHYFTHLEHHDNKAHEYFSFAFKYAIGMFFTTAVMTILVQAFKFKNYYSHDWGVIEQESIMFILCAFIIPLIWTINPWQVCHVMQRKQHFQSKHISQREANHLMADYHYDMGKRCAQIIQMMWFTSLYASLIPIGTVLILVGLILYYWIDKYNLLRRSSIDGNMSGSIILGCTKLLDAKLVWRSLGQIIFDIQIRQGARLQSLIFLGISIIYLLMPWIDILDTLNKENYKLNEKTYTQQQHRFVHDDYKNHHPIYRAAFSQNIQFGQNQIQALSLYDFAQQLIGKNSQPKQPGILQQQKLLQGDILNIFGKAPTKAAKT